MLRLYRDITPVMESQIEDEVETTIGEQFGKSFRVDV